MPPASGDPGGVCVWGGGGGVTLKFSGYIGEADFFSYVKVYVSKFDLAVK